MTLESEPTAPYQLPADAPPAPLDPVLDWVLQRVRLRARRRIAWLRKIWQETNAAGQEAEASDFHSEVDGYLTNADTPTAEAAWLAEDARIQAWNTALAQVDEALAADQQSRLAFLGRTFGLNRAEMDMLQTCLAIAIDPNLGRVYAYLQDHNGRSYVTESLVARLFGHGYCLPISAESPLIVWGLVVTSEAGRGEPPRLECDPFVRNWLLGANDLDESLVGIARWQPNQEPLSNWPVDETVRFIRKAFKQPLPHRVRLFVAGAEGSGRRTFAAGVCSALDLPLLTIEADRIAEPNWSQTFMRAQRQAYLNRCALAWHGPSVQERRWSQSSTLFRLQFVIGEVDEFIPPADGVIDYRTELPALSLAERQQLWLRLVPGSAKWSKKQLTQLSQRHPSSVGQIVTAAAKDIRNVAQAIDVLRESSRRRLGSLAQPMTNAFNPNDLIIPPWLRQSLETFTFEAGERALLWERPETQRLFPQGKGLVALFTGPPGTGKTMAAQVIANTLQLDLFRIDLSAIVSKYVGETSKNIERILSRAQRMNVVLLFDEADALFGKRTDVKDAHDRFANTDTNYLLQAIEQYPGVAILTSNKKANIDAGFMRRLRYVLEFPKPDPPQRLQLWQGLVSELAGADRADALANDLSRLAAMLDITGAQIKQSLLSALFMARQEKNDLRVAHLLRGLERELMKEGRGLGRQVYDAFKD